MSVEQVAARLVELCRQGKHLQAIDELYGPDIESVELFGDEHMPAVIKGFDAVKGKSVWWMDNHIMHSSTVSDPIVAPPGYFCVSMTIDVTNKPKNQRMKMSELCVYEVANGKIIRERFFYSMG
jgi:hypothetical protein